MFSTILIPVADDACNWDALELARTLARTADSALMVLYLMPAQAPVYVLPEMDTPIGAVSKGYDQALVRHRNALEREGLRILDRTLARLGVEKACGLSRVIYGAESVAQVILSAAQELEADLIVLGTRGPSEGLRTLEWSVIETVLRLTQCPAMTVRLQDRVLEHAPSPMKARI